MSYVELNVSDLLNKIQQLEAENANLLKVVEAARNLDLAQTVHFDVTRGPGRQRVYEIDEERVKDLERALATLDTNLPQFTGSGKNVSKEKVWPNTRRIK